jgi:GGDEF domain-containing protein
MKRARRYQVPVSVFLIAVKGYASFRDTFGRYRAEDLRRKLKRRLVFNLRDVDQVFMLSTEEIAVLLPHLEEAQARKVAESIQRTLLPESPINDIALGMAVASSRPGLDAEAMLVRAYATFQKVKEAGAAPMICMAE